MNKGLYLSVLCMTTAVYLLADGTYSTAMAQNFAPTTADPGVLIRELEDNRRGANILDDSVILPEYQDPQLDLSDEKVLDFQGITLEGSTVYTEESLAPLYNDYLGQAVSFADLHVIAQRITRQYREDGFIFSRVILPPQSIQDGFVKMQAIEGQLTDVQIVGEYQDNTGLIASMADKIRGAGGPANSRDIERYLLLIDDLPGITARSIVRPSEERAGGELIITIEENAFEGSIGFDNRGSRYVGPYRATIVGAFNSLFGLHDRTTVRGIAATEIEELRYIDITHEQQIGTEGMRFTGRAALTRTEPGGNIETLDIEGDSELLDLEVRYPIMRSRRSNLNVYAGFGALNSETDILGGAVETNDRVRNLRIGADYDFIDPWGINRVDLFVTQGLQFLGSTDDGAGRSRVNADHGFTRLNASASRVQDIFGSVSALISATGQLSNDPLLSSEEFSVGGPSFGRAYDAGEISGDRGWAGQVELRYSGVFNEMPVIQDYQAYSFIDYGRISNIDPTVGESDEESLTSYGAGVRFNMDYDMYSNFEVAVPMTDDVAAEGDDDIRFFFNILKRF